MGPSHLCLVDERGDVFTQGHNHFGQLGTGDRVGHEQLTQVCIYVCVCHRMSVIIMFFLIYMLCNAS